MNRQSAVFMTFAVILCMVANSKQLVAERIDRPQWYKDKMMIRESLENAKSDQERLKCLAQAYELILTRDNKHTTHSVCLELRNYTKKLPKTKVRQQFVRFLVFSSFSFAGGCDLKVFNHDDFDSVSRRMVKGWFLSHKTLDGYYLMGIVDFDTIKETLNDWRKQPWYIRIDRKIKYRASRRWDALLILARNGDKDAISELMTAVKNEKSLRWRINLLFRDIMYVKRPEIVRFLGEYLDSKEYIPGADDYPPTYCATRAAQAINSMIRCFPLTWKDYKAPPEEELKKAKAWLMSQKEFKFR